MNLDLSLSMHFYETSTAQVKTQMLLTLHYWLLTHSRVSVNFHTSLFVIHAERGNVTSKMFDQMAKDGLPMNRLVD